MQTSRGINLTMLCDFYELTMGNGYLAEGMEDRITYFDIFYRNIPDNGGYAVMAGLEQIVDYIQKLHFNEEDIRYLEGRGMFKPEFLDYLRSFRFTGTSAETSVFILLWPQLPLMVMFPAKGRVFIIASQNHLGTGPDDLSVFPETDGAAC